MQWKHTRNSAGIASQALFITTFRVQEFVYHCTDYSRRTYEDMHTQSEVHMHQDMFL